MERTLIIFKPDAVQRSVVGELITRFERVGLKIVGMKMMLPTEELVQKHYSDDLVPIVGEKTQQDWDKYGIEYDQSKEEIGRMVVDETRKFMRSGPVIAVVLEGGHSVEVVRKLVGGTGPKDSAPGTIRGDYAHISLGRSSLARKGAANLIHASGSVDEAKMEINLWFKPEELFGYTLAHEHLTHV
jgi:nucleoside-diphosphate kinase